MKDIKTSEIYSQGEGPGKWSVSLALRDDGSIQMHTYDESQTALEVWGKEDYEFWVTIPPVAVAKLAFELLQTRFAGRSDATDELRTLCKTNDIAYEWESYP